MDDSQKNHMYDELVPADKFLFSLLKEPLKRQRFLTNEGSQQNLIKVKYIPKDVFSCNFSALCTYYQMCMTSRSDSV